MDEKPTIIGELFTRLYLTPSAPIKDNTLFRNRLSAYLETNHLKEFSEIASYLKQEAGLEIPWFGYGYIFSDFFKKERIEFVLNSITLIWRFFYIYYYKTRKNVEAHNNWLRFVNRAFREENLAYSLDEKCGVHFFVDEEFERNRVSALKCLEAQRYAGVRAAFEAAHEYLDNQPPDVKGTVRSTFEALEILAKLIDPESKNLNRWMVIHKLKPMALSNPVDEVEAQAIGKMFEGFSEWVDGLHYYRHGQALEKVVAPSLSFAVYVISSGAAILRWLVEIDSKKQQL